MKLLFSHFIVVVYVLVAIFLIFAVSLQTGKSEGLTGALGGKTEMTPFLRKKTWDEKLDRVTGYLAWSFLVLSTAIVLLSY